MINMDSLLTIEEVATFLNLSRDTVYRMAQVGKIPASKVGTQWRFRKRDIDGWLDLNSNIRVRHERKVQKSNSKRRR